MMKKYSAWLIRRGEQNFFACCQSAKAFFFLLFLISLFFFVVFLSFQSGGGGQVPLFLLTLWLAFVLHAFLFCFWNWVRFIYFSFFWFSSLFLTFFIFLSLPLSLIVQCLPFGFEINNVLLAYLCCVAFQGTGLFFFNISEELFIQGRFLAQNVLQICHEELCVEILM